MDKASYEEFYNVVKDGLRFYYPKLSDKELTDYLKSQEDVVQDGYESYLDSKVDIPLRGHASGAIYSLYMLYE